jgi:hypothetical protein
MKKEGSNFLRFMVKEEKEENKDSDEFQVFSFTNKTPECYSFFSSLPWVTTACKFAPTPLLRNIQKKSPSWEIQFDINEK